MMERAEARRHHVRRHIEPEEAQRDVEHATATGSPGDTRHRKGLEALALGVNARP
jgi:hypothetical protein